MEVVETVITITEIADLLNKIFDSDGDGQIIPPELAEVLNSFDNGEIGDNDIEVLLDDIRTSLVTDDSSSYMEIVSQRLDIIDERLDAEFLAVNECFGLIATSLLSFFSFKVITWFYNLVSR